MGGKLIVGKPVTTIPVELGDYRADMDIGIEYTRIGLPDTFEHERTQTNRALMILPRERTMPGQVSHAFLDIGYGRREGPAQRFLTYRRGEDLWVPEETTDPSLSFQPESLEFIACELLDVFRALLNGNDHKGVPRLGADEMRRHLEGLYAGAKNFGFRFGGGV